MQCDLYRSNDPLQLRTNSFSSKTMQPLYKIRQPWCYSDRQETLDDTCRSTLNFTIEVRGWRRGAENDEGGQGTGKGMERM